MRENRIHMRFKQRRGQKNVKQTIEVNIETVPPSLTLKTLRWKFEFSFVAPIHFLQKYWGEVDKVSSIFMLCDHVRNSLDHSVLQSIDITRRNLMLVTLRA